MVFDRELSLSRSQDSESWISIGNLVKLSRVVLAIEIQICNADLQCISAFMELKFIVNAVSCYIRHPVLCHFLVTLPVADPTSNLTQANKYIM